MEINEYDIFIFGSYAEEKFDRRSDLDIGLKKKNGERMTLSELAKVTFAFEDTYKDLSSRLNLCGRY